MALTKFKFGQNGELQKSGVGEVRTCTNKVWAKSGLTKNKLGQNLDLQTSGLGKVCTYKNRLRKWELFKEKVKYFTKAILLGATHFVENGVGEFVVEEIYLVSSMPTNI